VSGVVLLVIPSELDKINTDLVPKVGSSCSSVFPASSIKASGYLGANPKTVVSGANALPTWKAASVSFTGNLIDHKTVTGSGAFQSTGYYECGFEISGLSNAAFVELLVSSPLFEMLGDYGKQSKKLRYLEIAMPGQQILLDSNWKLVDTATQGLVIGGEGQCQPLKFAKVLQVLEDFPPVGCGVCGIRRLINECPQCGIRKVREGLFEVTYPLALLRNPKFKGVVDALKLDEQFRFAPTQLRLRDSMEIRR
jgi:hypothetical protein